MGDKVAIGSHSVKMEVQEICPNSIEVQNKSDCQLPNPIAEKKPDEHVQEVSELSLKKPEDPFKVPTVLNVKMCSSKLTAGDCSSPAAATSDNKSVDTVAGNLIPGGDVHISQNSPSSDGFLIPSSVAPRPPAASCARQPRGPALLSSKTSSSEERAPAAGAAGGRAAAGSVAAGAAGVRVAAGSAAAGAAGGRVAAGSAAAYRPPAWAGCPPQPYSLEVLRGGRIVDTVSLQCRPCVVFGRLPDCDVRLEHPSISRHHAALVYRASGDDGRETGYYLYDLGSTHGSTLNKLAVQPKVYCRMRVGHMCKFGSSTRLFILQGPEEDREEESHLTVTELQEFGQKRQQERQERLEGQQERLERLDDQEPEPEPEVTAAHTTAAGDGISWGMAEDADEESDLQFNPFALGEAENEQLYLVDPKRTLRGWFEREGLELEYQTEELPGGRHVCRVTLPLDTADGRPPVAEAQHVGKKKEAVIQCALEACRLLDRSGVLRQARQESRQSRRHKPSGYDSDEDDTFLDRTGAVERKRQRRQQAAHTEPKADTYQSLLSQYQKVQSEALAVERRLQQSESATQAETAADRDELDAFMTRLSQGAFSDRQEKRKLTTQLAQLRSQEGRLCRLVNLARPATLPPLRPPPQTAASGRSPLTGFIGRRKGKAGAAGAGRAARGPVPAPSRPVSGAGAARGPAPAPSRPVSAAAPAAEEEDEEDNTAGRPAPPEDVAARLAPSSAPDPDRKIDTGDGQQEPSADDKMDTGSAHQSAVDTDCRRVTGGERELGDPTADRDRTEPRRPPPAGLAGGGGPRSDTVDVERSSVTERAGCVVTEGAVPAPVTRGLAPPQQYQQHAAEARRKRQANNRRPDKQLAAESYSELAGEGSYDVWMPPEGQSGDGRTSLNDKLGY